MGKIKGGYILQPRIFGTSDASNFPPIVRELWFLLLRGVNHQDNGQYKRGSGFFNFTDIQNALSWRVGYRREVYQMARLIKALRRLNEGNMTATTKATRGMIVTICNYDYYQDPKNYEGNTKATRSELGGHTKNKNVKNEKNIIPPTPLMVKSYCEERDNGIDAGAFIAHYEANGWKRGNTKVKDWQACVRTWEQRRKETDKKTFNPEAHGYM